MTVHIKMPKRREYLEIYENEARPEKYYGYPFYETLPLDENIQYQTRSTTIAETTIRITRAKKIKKTEHENRDIDRFIKKFLEKNGQRFIDQSYHLLYLLRNFLYSYQHLSPILREHEADGNEELGAIRFQFNVDTFLPMQLFQATFFSNFTILRFFEKIEVTLYLKNNLLHTSNDKHIHECKRRQNCFYYNFLRCDKEIMFSKRIGFDVMDDENESSENEQN